MAGFNVYEIDDATARSTASRRTSSTRDGETFHVESVPEARAVTGDATNDEKPALESTAGLPSRLR